METETTHQQVVDIILALSDDDLATPRRFLWLGEQTLWESARIDPQTEEHRIATQQWLRAKEDI